MWKKEENGTPKPPGDTSAGKDGEIIAFVGKGVQFKGAISYEGTVRIDGRVDGEIRTTGMLIVGEEAVLTATVQAGTVVSKGKITGDVIAKERVKLMSPAVLSGSVQAPVFSMEEGVTFDGTCDMAGGNVRDLPLDPGVRLVETSPANVKRITG